MVVVHDQRACAVQRPGQDPAAPGVLVPNPEPGGETEGAAGARLGLDPDRSAHQLDQAPRDGEPEAGAAVLACSRAVGLAERLEETRRLLARHADAGVGYLDP